MSRSLALLVLVLAGGAAAFWFLHSTPPAGPGTPGAAGAGAAQGAGGKQGASGGVELPTATPEQVLPADTAAKASPMFEAHSSWPKATELPAFPAKPSKDLEQAAFELEHDVQQWFSKDLRWTRGVDGTQVYMKGVNAAGSVTVLAARDRMKGQYTLGFEAIFADATAVNAESTSRRLKVVLVPELFSEIDQRALKPSPAVEGPDDFAGFVGLSGSPPGTIFPNFYCYARPKQVVGVLQTIAMTKTPPRK